MKNFIELLGWTPGNTIEAHDEGGGDPESLLFRIKQRNQLVANDDMREADVVLKHDEVRALFNWLGVWLVKGRHDG